MKKLFPKSFIKILVFAGLIVLAISVFIIDLRISSDDITILVPYISIIMAAVWFVGNKTGGFFVVLAISFWFLSKTNLLSQVNKDNYIDLVMKFTFIILQYLFIILLRRMNTKVKNSALFDELTGLHNRRGFFYLVDYELAQIERGNKPFSFLYFDIDNFKHENDSKGHREGDEILRAIGMILAATIRAYDISARLGGDEFCIYMSGTNRDQGMEIVDRINRRFRSICQERSWGTTLSMGMVSSHKRLPIEEMLSRGDALMYEAKRGGKNRIESADLDEALNDSESNAR